MGDFLKTGMTWLAGQMQEHVSQTATYRRGIAENTAVPVTLGETEFPVETPERMTVKVRTQDFLITASELTLDSAQIEPEPGDQIEISGLGTFQVYTPDEQCWRWSDPDHIMLRIHTREI